MRVDTDQTGPHVSEVTGESLTPRPELVRRSLPEVPAACPFMFTFQKGLVTSVGYTEETCVAVLLKHLMMQLQHEPCDDFRRAIYHLVKAQESLKHHRVA